MNLIMNAVQAMDKSDGIIRIGTEDVGDSVIIEIEDNGMGIPEENFPKLFSPFFTTKPVGEGTGLGLAISYGIIQKHAGKIDVQTELGKGSVFTIRIPMKNQIQVTEGSKLAVTEAPSVRPSESKWPKNGARS